MKNEKVFVLVFLAILMLGACYTPPAARPAMSQTVVTIQRYPSPTDAKKPMEVFIDDTKSQYSVADGQSVSVPVNDGVHYIYVKVGKNSSETLNFTASQKTLSFMESVEGGFLKKAKVTLSRSSVDDDIVVLL